MEKPKVAKATKKFSLKIVPSRLSYEVGLMQAGRNTRCTYNF